VSLPFQTVETVNESAADRRQTLELFGRHGQTEWRNRLIWGDKKYVLPSLLAEFAGKVNLIYIDPPFDRRIAQDVKLPSQFSALAPKVREFLERKAFGGNVNLADAAMLKAISSNVAQYVTVKTFVEALRKLVVAELEPQLLHPGRELSETPPFPWSRATFAASKCVFNLVPCDNEFEKEFAQFLEKADDVSRFAKLPEQFGFAIEYTDNATNLRYYEPDFVVLTDDGTHYIVETKGMEDINVVNKDRAAQLWCENATQLAKRPWAYVKVRQTEYKKLQPTLFEDLLILKPEAALRI